MEIVQTMEEMQRYISNAVRVSGDSPVLLDRYLGGAIEVDVDVLADGEDVFRDRRHGTYRGSRHSFGRQRLRLPRTRSPIKLCAILKNRPNNLPAR